MMSDALIVFLPHIPNSKPSLQTHGFWIHSASCSCHHLLCWRCSSPASRLHWIFWHVWWGAKEQSHLDTSQHHPSPNKPPNSSPPFLHPKFATAKDCANCTGAKMQWSMIRTNAIMLTVLTMITICKASMVKKEKEKKHFLQLQHYAIVLNISAPHVLCMNGQDHWFQYQWYLWQGLLDGSSISCSSNSTFGCLAYVAHLCDSSTNPFDAGEVLCPLG